MQNDLNKSDKEWKQILTDEQYRVCRQKGTEAPFSGQYHACNELGLYICIGCGNELFNAETKFDSGSGWPSFTHPIAIDHIKQNADYSLGIQRIEVVCNCCGSHLGHIFDDGPSPGNSRYCINSVALHLVKKKVKPLTKTITHKR